MADQELAQPCTLLVDLLLVRRLRTASMANKHDRVSELRHRRLGQVEGNRADRTRALDW